MPISRRLAGYLGLAIAALIIGVAAYLLFFQSPYAEIQLSGTVKVTSAQGPVLESVQVSEGPDVCTTQELQILTSQSDLDVGDKVQIQGRYNRSTCEVDLSQRSHSLEITAQAPDPIQVEGVVARSTQGGVVIQDVQIIEGPSPCTTNSLQVQIQESVLAPDELLSGDQVSVNGVYHYEDCRITVDQPQHTVNILPVPIEMTGTVSERQGQRFTLRDVSVNEGPAPCSNTSLTVSAANAPISVPDLQTEQRIEVAGEYDSVGCVVRINSRTHRITEIASPIQVTGRIESKDGQQFTLTNVTVQSGPMPCSTNDLTVQTNGRVDMTQTQKAIRTEVEGMYDPDSCEILLSARDHSIALQPTEIRLQGSVNSAGLRSMRLNDVATLSGPAPCRNRGIDVTADSSFHWDGRETAQQHGSRLELEGRYDPNNCEIVDTQILDVLDVPSPTATTTQAGQANVGSNPASAQPTPVWQRFMGSGGLVLLGDNKLYTGALGFEAFNSVFLKVGVGFGSGETTNEHGIPVDLEFQAYGVGAFYEISDHFVIGGATGLLSISAEIPGEWSDDKSIPFVAVMGGVKFGPAVLTGGGALPLD